MSNMNPIKNESGKVLGYTKTIGGRTTYSDAGGKAVAYVSNGKTSDAGGALKGFGDQGMRILSERKGR